MSDIKEIVAAQRAFFAEGRTKDLEFRLRQLAILKKAVREREQDIQDALKKDLNKDAFDAYAAEIGIVLEEVGHLAKHLPKWSAKKRVRTSLANFLSSSYVYPEPYGIALILSPWNYPFQLAISPLAGAMAAGNCAVVKPSAYSPHTSEVIESLIRDHFPPEYIAAVRGGREENQSLLEEKFDYIFFTGSVAVGKTVMAAASRHLTPVTLELGGKSPCIVDETANLALAARRIVWGKFLNAGQTCIAPDYLMVQRSVKQKLLEEMIRAIASFYGPAAGGIDNFPKIINEKHYRRLVSLLEGGEIILGGDLHPETLKISPTLVDHVEWDSPLMQGEIFGPILPILEFETLEQVVSQVNQHPKPLALYLFTSRKDREARILRDISFGGGCVNDTLMHVASKHMPFGGVGESGMGQYHGKSSFHTFTHYKSVLRKSNRIDVPLRYPTHKNISLLKRIVK